MSELVKDVLEIITVFSAKLHSMRSRKEERPRADVSGRTPRRPKAQGNADRARECVPMSNS